MRIVFNSSAKVNGASLNGCLAKGPSLLNNILGILLRFREENFAFIGDISKMFHSIDIPVEDQMMHLFLWRNLQPQCKAKTFAITAVNMGDRPASAIAQTALRESALEATEEYPEASKIIIRNSYMDDIPASVKGPSSGHQTMGDVESILQKNGFTIKEWNYSGKVQSAEQSKDQKAVQSLLNKAPEERLGKVLGMGWEAERDIIKFSLIELVEARMATTKRECLSTIYSIYDLMGLLTPITVTAKIIL